MSEKKNPSKQSIIIMSVCLLVAVVLAVTLFVQRSSLNAQVAQLTTDLSASRTEWEAVAAEKETLQAQLTEKENALKEAQLSL